MKTKIKIRDKVYQLEISEVNENLLNVKVDDKSYFFSKNELGELISVNPKEDEKLKSLFKEDVFLGALAEKEIKSPITGVISLVAVRENETLKRGQKVATIIAMKMENEIIAETAGIIESVKIKDGQLVNSGDVLIILK